MKYVISSNVAIEMSTKICMLELHDLMRLASERSFYKIKSKRRFQCQTLNNIRTRSLNNTQKFMNS